MKNKVMLLTIVAVAVLALVINVQGNAGSVKTPEVQESQKVYAIYTQGLMTSGSIVSNISRQDYFGIQCIKGTSVGNWVDGKNIYIPVEQITMIIEFDSIEDYNSSKDKYKPEEYDF